MRQKSESEKLSSERLVKDIRRATRKQYSAEENPRGAGWPARGASIAELCRREGIAESLYYSWSKEFLEAGKRRLAGDTARAATNSEVKDLKRQAQELKEVVAEQALELQLLLKKRDRGWGRRGMRVPGFRKARDHPSGRAVPPAGATDAANTRHPVLDVLSMVCALPDRRAGGARRQTVDTEMGLESHPRQGARTHHRDGSGRAGVVAARTRHTLHRCRRLFCARNLRCIDCSRRTT